MRLKSVTANPMSVGVLGFASQAAAEVHAKLSIIHAVQAGIRNC